MTLIAVIADTHVPGRARTLPASAWARVAEADLVLHAGDVVSTSLLDEIACYDKPVHVAIGNCDGADVRAWGALDVVELDMDGVRIAMTHDSGERRGRAERMHKRFPDAHVVVFGHSHLPLYEYGLGGQLLLNPGSPSDRRRAPAHTMALLRIDSGNVGAELIQLDRSSLR